MQNIRSATIKHSQEHRIIDLSTSENRNVRYEMSQKVAILAFQFPRIRQCRSNTLECLNFHRKRVPANITL